MGQLETVRRRPRLGYSLNKSTQFEVDDCPIRADISDPRPVLDEV